jgi:hypothetical protein
VVFELIVPVVVEVRKLAVVRILVAAEAVDTQVHNAVRPTAGDKASAGAADTVGTAGCSNSWTGTWRGRHWHGGGHAHSGGHHGVTGAAITAITMAAATIMEGSMAGMTTEGTWRRPPSWGHNGGHHDGHHGGHHR